MATIYFSGVNFNPTELKKSTAFSSIEILSEKGQPAKIGFKKGSKSEFGMAKFSFPNINESIDSLLYEAMNVLRKNKSKITSSGVENISISINLTVIKEIHFTIDTETIRFSSKIPVDVEFTIKQDVKTEINSLVGDLIKKYHLSFSNPEATRAKATTTPRKTTRRRLAIKPAMKKAVIKTKSKQ